MAGVQHYGNVYDTMPYTAGERGEGPKWVEASMLSHTLRTPLKPDLFLKAVLVRCMLQSITPLLALSERSSFAACATSWTCTQWMLQKA